ncbi:MAG TPA: PHB depolymerase family esterase [Acidimicrobiia bacterium]
MSRRALGALLAGLLAAGVAAIPAVAGAGEGVAPAPSPGCDGTDPVAVGEERITTTSGGVERWYFRHVPPAHDGDEPLPVVIDLHGYLEGADVHKVHSDLGAYGDEQGFVTITPQGTGDPVRWDATVDSADMEFVGDLLDEIGATLCVDERRIFVTGLSNGAFMTSAIACAYADRIAAVAPVAGIRVIDDCDPDRPVPVVAFHGTEDGFVSFDGGLGDDAADLPAPDGSGRTVGDLPEARDAAGGPSVPEITAAWAERDDCRAKPRRRAVADDVTRVRYRCPDGADVVLYRVEGGGHTWPGSEFSQAIESVTGATTFSISANEVMWEFFEQHPLERGADAED